MGGRKADIIPPTFPSVNHFGCKSSEKFADEQIFGLKVYSLRLKGKNTPMRLGTNKQRGTERCRGVMDKETSARMRTKCTMTTVLGKKETFLGV